MSMFDWTRLRRITTPDPILTPLQAQTHCRIGHADDDKYLASLIEAATAYIEGPNGIGTALLTQQWRMSMDDLPRSFLIGLGPVQAIDGITREGIAVTDFSADLDATPARVAVHRAFGLCHSAGAVKVTFTAGYGADATDIPADLRHAILMLVAHLYENREATIAGGTSMAITEVPLAVSSILDRYRAGNFC